MERQVGFGFRPSEDELVGYYLRHKIDGNNWLVEDTINEVNICDFDPWDLRFQSKYHSTYPVWYFFSRRDNKYGTETRQNRQTASGKWKLTGDAVDVKDQWGRWCGCPKTKIGYKRILVFIGNKSFTTKSDWIMHEFYYSLVPSQLQKTYVICRLEYKGDDTNIPLDNLTDHTPTFVPNPTEGFVMNQSLQDNTNPDYNTGIRGQLFNENFNMEPVQGNLGFLNDLSMPWQIEENFNMQLLHEHDTPNYLPWTSDFYNYEQPVSYAAGTCDNETHIIQNYLRETLAEEKEIQRRNISLIKRRSTA